MPRYNPFWLSRKGVAFFWAIFRDTTTWKIPFKITRQERVMCVCATKGRNMEKEKGEDRSIRRV
jgi:hypothetical protein